MAAWRRAMTGGMKRWRCLASTAANEARGMLVRKLSTLPHWGCNRRRGHRRHLTGRGCGRPASDTISGPHVGGQVPVLLADEGLAGLVGPVVADPLLNCLENHGCHLLPDAVVAHIYEFDPVRRVDGLVSFVVGFWITIQRYVSAVLHHLVLGPQDHFFLPIRALGLRLGLLHSFIWALGPRAPSYFQRTISTSIWALLLRPSC